jgi:hypothetical protein
MLFRRTRLLAPALLTTAGLAIAGCGGGSNGDEATYVKTYEGACKKIVTSATGAQPALAALGTGDSVSTAAITKVRTSLSEVLETFDSQVSVLANADAPSKWSSFQKSLKGTADDARKAIGTAKSTLAQVKTRQDLPKIREAFQSLDLKSAKSEKVPDDLARKAPSCNTLLNSGG